MTNRNEDTTTAELKYPGTGDYLRDLAARLERGEIRSMAVQYIDSTEQGGEIAQIIGDPSSLPELIKEVQNQVSALEYKQKLFALRDELLAQLLAVPTDTAEEASL